MRIIIRTRKACRWSTAMSNPVESREPWRAPGTNGGFNQRCVSALTHPTTVIALATLLLNDVLFKALWPHAWITGKLSDLAWVIFALPLLAFLLSLCTRGNRTAARTAFITAYVGLPLLYAAFNTFEPVHYWILRGISIASGGSAGAPLDATDSIVIPLGWGIAIWVWRRPALSAESLRLRWGMLVAGVAVLASIATPAEQLDLGITDVGVSEDGLIHANASYDYASSYDYPRNYSSKHQSTDGGLTWVTEPDYQGNVTWGGQTAETPRGRYTVVATGIMLIGADGRGEVVYSTAYLSNAGNLWAQRHSRSRFGIITTRPAGHIIYDEHSGNLIIAMGSQGVLVGTPDGRWTPYAVGRYTPTDFTFLGKTGLLLPNISFWAAVLALSMSMTAAGLIFLQNSLGMRRVLLCTLLGGLGLLLFYSGALSLLADPPRVYGGLMIIGLVLLFLAGESAGMGWRSLMLAVAVPGAIVLALLYFGVSLFGFNSVPPQFSALILLGMVAYSIWGRNTRAIWTIASAIAIYALLASVAFLWMFGGSDVRDFNDFYNSEEYVIGVAALTFGIASLLISLRLRYWRATIASLVGMKVLVILAFMLWLHLGIPLGLAKLSAFALVAFAAFRLAGYIKRSSQRTTDESPR